MLLPVQKLKRIKWLWQPGCGVWLVVLTPSSSYNTCLLFVTGQTRAAHYLLVTQPLFQRGLPRKQPLEYLLSYRAPPHPLSVLCYPLRLYSNALERVSSFRAVPGLSQMAVSALQLASQGFYYENNEVTCYRCQRRTRFNGRDPNFDPAHEDGCDNLASSRGDNNQNYRQILYQNDDAILNHQQPQQDTPQQDTPDILEEAPLVPDNVSRTHRETAEKLEDNDQSLHPRPANLLSMGLHQYVIGGESEVDGIVYARRQVYTNQVVERQAIAQVIRAKSMVTVSLHQLSNNRDFPNLNIDTQVFPQGRSMV
ncbi:uncharacterized protein LOC131939309 [Physella acuta]|uniref:uncharacterized protein LOC131939309 n=1 Tax=Physella acuta TaxID=109671 RepID=UPI0027DDF3FB|nr:uncharacterized protein LOC131939309 [Physella acuta]